MSGRDYLRAIARRLAAAGHGARGAIVREAAEHLGCSVSALYARLERETGWNSGRRTRADKGVSAVSEEALLRLAAMQNEGRRENGKQVLWVPTAASILAGAGLALPVTTGHAARLLRTRKIGVAAQRQPQPAAHLRAEHPNHVHQVDPSLCLLYYVGGRQRMIRDDQLYKNKLGGLAQLKLKCWRYLCYDRASGAIQVRYYEAEGESEQTLFEFLMWAWAKKPELSLHGVPRVMLWDKGSANTSASVTGVLRALDVLPIPHSAGNARAKGGVECAQNIVETQFESRLRFDPVSSVEELNAAAWAWCEAFNSGAVHGVPTLLRREGLAQPTARYALWHRIRAEELRELPDIGVMRRVLAGRAQPRKVRHDLSIAFKHPDGERPDVYSVAGLAGINVGDTVEVRPMLYGTRAVSVSIARYDGEPLVYRLEPARSYDAYGQVADAAVPGETFAAVPDTDAARAIKQMQALAYPDCDTVASIRAARAKGGTPFGGELRAIQSLQEQERLTWLPRTGATIAVRPIVEARRLSALEASRALRARGIQVPQQYDRIDALYPDGVPEDALQSLGEQLLGEAAKCGMRMKSAQG